MDKTADPRLHRLISAPVILVAVHVTPVGKHSCESQFCSIGCYSTVYSLVKYLARYTEHTPLREHICYRCYTWSPQTQNWRWKHIPAHQGQQAMLTALGCSECWETHLTKKKNGIMLKELHTVHPHATDYLVVQMEECQSREDQESSYIRIKEWKNANLVECIVSKVLHIDHAPVPITFPTSITPITLCNTQSAKLVSVLFGGEPATA